MDGNEVLPKYLYSERQLDKLESYIEERFGAFDEVMHEIVSPDIHLDIAIVHPTDEQPFYKLVTMGAGAYKMNVPKELKKAKLERAEYVICLPKGWKLNSGDEQDYWPIRQLKTIGRLPIFCNSWLGFGHTVQNEDCKPYAPNTKFNSMVLINAGGKDFHGVKPLKIGLFEQVNFYQLYPLYQEELDFEREHSMDELAGLMDEDDDCVVNINRRNACISK